MSTDTVQRTWTVGTDDTAVALGSGSVSVLATPRVIAWMEACCADLVADRLDDGATTVGPEVAIRHVAPSPVGASVRVVARLDETHGRRRVFCVSAIDEQDRVLAEGTMTRAIVRAAGFGS